MLLWVVIIFLLLYALLIFYYSKSWHSLDYFSAAKNEGAFISVVIPARNEEDHIEALFESLKRQTYPAGLFEIILVDDFSTDGTARVAATCSLPNLKLIQPDAAPSTASKKKAIEAGVRQARGEMIVTTDADCILPADWLLTISAFYSKKAAAFIVAPVKFSYNENLFQKFQAIDFMVLQGITAASVGARFHSMCNGANLGYQKRAFEQVHGFDGIDTIASGDDMLLMYKIWKANPDKVFYLKSKEAIVCTEAMLSLRSFFMQRKRWASKTLVYDDFRIIVVLVFVYLFNLLFLILLGAIAFNPVYGLYAIAFLVLKTGIEWRFVSSVARFYDERKLLKYFFLFQPLHIFYTIIIGIAGQFGKYEWKGRRTR